MAHPDFSKPFILDTDASDVAIGAVLSQNIDGKERVIAFASKTLTKPERRYCVTRKELLAVVHFVKYYRHYLSGRRFTVRTDHGSLRWLMQFKDPEGQVARWLEVLSSFDMEIIHRPGRQHKNADGMSRIRCKQCGMVNDEEETEIDGVTADDIRAVKQVAESGELEDIKSSQEKDPDITKVKTWLKSGTKPDSKTIACESYFLRSLVAQWQRLELRGDILMRRWDVLGTSLVNWQCVVPLRQRREVLKHSHDIKASGHLGMKKTLSRIRQSYYWPGFQKDVKAYIAGCEACSKRKDPTRTKRAPMNITRSGFPMERIAIDILGELPRTDRGNKYILVIGDYFTKWTECFAMENMEAKTVARILVEEVIARFGVPSKIHSDQGRQFESSLFKEMCQLLQIEKTRTTPYHPQSDGMVERFNRTLVSMLSTFVNSSHTDWDVQLPYVMMAYRSAEHETTGASPNLCMLGRETTTPLDILYEMPASINTLPQNQWVWELQERLESVHTFVREQTGTSMHRQKKFHDRNLSFESFAVGDKVYVFFPVKRVGCSSKLTSYWRGPFEIMAKLSDVLYKVNCGRSNDIQVIHCDRLRRAKSQVLAGEFPEIDIDELEDTAETEAEAEVEPRLEDDSEEVRIPRKRRKPAWLSDYVLTCVGEHSCDVCLKTFKKKAYLAQHNKRKHWATNTVVATAGLDEFLDKKGPAVRGVH